MIIHGAEAAEVKDYRHLKMYRNLELEYLNKPIYLVTNKHSGAKLGIISWFRSWKKFVFHPDEKTSYDCDCLNCICSFLLEVDQGLHVG